MDNRVNNHLFSGTTMNIKLIRSNSFSAFNFFSRAKWKSLQTLFDWNQQEFYAFVGKSMTLVERRVSTDVSAKSWLPLQSAVWVASQMQLMQLKKGFFSITLRPPHPLRFISLYIFVSGTRFHTFSVIILSILLSREIIHHKINQLQSKFIHVNVI